MKYERISVMNELPVKYNEYIVETDTNSIHKVEWRGEWMWRGYQITHWLKPLPDTEGVDWVKLEKEFMKENGGKSANDIETIAAYYNWISEWFKQKLSGKHIGEWIEVDIEKVPPMEVLCYNKAGDYMVGHLRAMPYNKFECEAENETLLQVTHYKSLTPPKQIV